MKRREKEKEEKKGREMRREEEKGRQERVNKGWTRGKK